MKIAIYGIGNLGEAVLSSLQQAKYPPEIVYFVRTKKNQEFFHGIPVVSVEEICYDDFDYLVLASFTNTHEMIAALKKLHNGYERHSSKVVSFGELCARLTKNMPYYSCRVEPDLVYIGRQDDLCIPAYMSLTERNWSDDMIDAFFELTRKYYPENATDTDGYFLDIGANIGTTSIYVEKKVRQPLKIIGFEPGQSNYDLFRVNCILNHSSRITAEMLGLSDVTREATYRYVAANSGSSSIIEDHDFAPGDSVVNVARLDDYLTDRQISPQQVSYIWMDVEGHEAQVIAGAMETLQAKKIPLLQEFNPEDYRLQNTGTVYFDNMKRVYSSFIDVSDYLAGKSQVYSISELPDIGRTNLFFF